MNFADIQPGCHVIFQERHDPNSRPEVFRVESVSSVYDDHSDYLFVVSIYLSHPVTPGQRYGTPSLRYVHGPTAVLVLSDDQLQALARSQGERRLHRTESGSIEIL